MGVSDTVQHWLWTPADEVAMEVQVASLTCQPRNGQRGRGTFLPEWQMHIAAKPSDRGRGRGAKVWQPQSASHHYQGKNKAADMWSNPHSHSAHLAPADLVAMEVSEYIPMLGSPERAGGTEATFQPDGQHTLQLNPVEKTKLQTRNAPFPTHPSPSSHASFTLHCAMH